MSILNPTAEAETLLVRALSRLFPPRWTLWKTVCMDCKRTSHLQRLPYEEQYGRETTTHGLCIDCDAIREAKDLSNDETRS